MKKPFKRIGNPHALNSSKPKKSDSKTALQALFLVIKPQKNTKLRLFKNTEKTNIL